MDLDWKRLLNLEGNEVLGLDIGSSAVKMVQIRKDNASCAVTAAGIVDISDGAESDESRREINTVRAISKCFGATSIGTRSAVCSVCGPEVAVRYFKFPLLPPEEIEGAVILEAEQVCPFNIDESAVDYQLIPNGENNVSGILVAATNKLIRGKNRLAENTSLNCVLMDVDGLALLNCFSEYEKTAVTRTTVILNVGSSFTNLVIIGDNGVPFIRDMSYAGDDIINGIATEHNIPTEAVGKILSGYENSGQPQLELSDSMAKACQKLIADITETLRYYTAQKKTAFVEKILVCGGFALVKGFVELLDKQLPAATVLWNPFDKIRCSAGPYCRDILQKKGPAMAVAAGLAMRSI